MNTSEFIKKIRHDNNLTQRDLADILHVTYQAVSKWERGLSIPDISVLKEISKLYNVSIDELIGGEQQKKKNNKIYFIIGAFVLVIIVMLLVIFLNRDKESFEFKKITTSCSAFNITGSVAYSSDKTSIYISNVEFCGDENNTVYEKIECNFYETLNNTNTLISSCGSKDNTNLEDFLKTVKINVDNYKTMCTTFASSEVYLEINAYGNNNVITGYKIPIDLEDNC